MLQKNLCLGVALACATLAAPAAAGPQPRDEAYGALVALGYKPAEAARLLKKVDADGLGAEDMIREALKAAAQ